MVKLTWKEKNKGGKRVKKKWILTMITPMLALVLATGCASNDNNEPLDEGPLDGDIQDPNIDNNELDRNIEDGNLIEGDPIDGNQVDENLNNDRTNEIEQGNEIDQENVK